ncbi:hypothetical protein GGR54DRAFT_174847 [Hypoxylon sp. NC1633]|nr:hypothetical protein GGR54DRAFT_174847 [Hypoxylon sp. NC1633]
MPHTNQEESSPSPVAVSSSRIKRNTACTSCRDAKVRCNPSLNTTQPCQRCAKLHLTCVVDRTHKRVSRKRNDMCSKLDELVQEIRSIKQSVGGQPVSLPSQAAGYSQQNEAPDALKSPVQSRLGVPSPISISTGPEVVPTSVASIPTTIAPSSVTHTPASIQLGQITAEPTLPRALGSQPFTGDDIDYYFQKYFECYHLYFPIVRIRDPNKCYDTCPLLFWTIIYVASRRYAKTPTVFPFLQDAIKRDSYAALTSTALSLPLINALMVLSAWIFPDVRFVNDPTTLFTGSCMNACLQLGVHTGKGGHQEYSHSVWQNSFTDEEASYTWAGYNIISQRITTAIGLPSLGGLFNQAIQNIIDGRTPFQVPSTFRVLLECQKFSNRVSKTMGAHLEESRGVSPQIVQLLEDEWTVVKGLICSERADNLDRFNALIVQVDIQTYYMMPQPDYDPEALKRNILRAYVTAQAVLRECLELDRTTDFLRHIPHFYLRALLAAACVVYRIAGSSYFALLDRKAVEQSAADAILIARRAALADGDLPSRLRALIEGWTDRLLRAPAPDGIPAQWFAAEPVCAYSRRLSASVTYDCFARWKNEHIARFAPSLGDPAAAGAGAGAAAANGNRNSETPGVLGTASGADALPSIDWTFMDDFDWDFEPLPVMAAPT